jgi:hypothetical protein
MAVVILTRGASDDEDLFASKLAVRAHGIAHCTPKRESLPYTTPTTPFPFIKLLRKQIKSNLLSYIFKEYKCI